VQRWREQFALILRLSKAVQARVQGLVNVMCTFSACQTSFLGLKLPLYFHGTRLPSKSKRNRPTHSTLTTDLFPSF
jgi:hypothetical protein